MGECSQSGCLHGQLCPLTCIVLSYKASGVTLPFPKGRDFQQGLGEGAQEQWGPLAGTVGLGVAEKTHHRHHRPQGSKPGPS